MSSGSTPLLGGQNDFDVVVCKAYCSVRRHIGHKYYFISTHECDVLIISVASFSESVSTASTIATIDVQSSFLVCGYVFRISRSG